MKHHAIIVCIFMLFVGCASFKELWPEPPVQSAERGFIELRDDEEDFILMESEKYFIRFPRPADNHYYLLLQSKAKKQVHNYLTATFDDGKGEAIPIVDEASSHDSLSLFAIDTLAASYYWVMDTVRFNVPLTVRYRYVPQWRYIVETKYEEYSRLLVGNKVNRSIYQRMGPEFDFAAFTPRVEQERLREKKTSLTAMNEALVKLESVFPKNIAASKDTMYERYASLSKDTRDELLFQSDYDALLTVLHGESETRWSFSAFMERVDDFAKFLEQQNRFRKPIVDHLKSVFLRRLSEAPGVYETQIRDHNQLAAVQLKPPTGDVEKLYKACGEEFPERLEEIRTYSHEFNTSVEVLVPARQKLESARSASEQKVLWPDDSYYPRLLTTLDEARKEMPAFTLDRFGRYKRFSMTTLLSQEIRRIGKLIDDLQRDYRRASEVVEKISGLRPPKEYRGIIRLLGDNRDLGFLLAHYPDIDELLLNLLAGRIRDQLEAGSWKETEEGLYELMNDKDYLNPSAIAPRKLEAIRSLESDLFERVKKLTFDRVDAFTKNHETTLENVPALYADSAFTSRYVLTFSSESPARLAQRQRTIEEYLNQVKHFRFPEAAIRPVYRELTRAPQDQGVEKARAILEHSKFYKGQDRTIRNMIDECNPAVAKTVNKPKDYRRVFVLPTNQAAKAANEYMFRINVKIPSEAKFPVYDVNIKVPREIAEKAGIEQWFTQMTLNKKVIKTEGHMRVTAPTAENDYESQITPIQMEKDRDNIIEVKFKYPSFKLFEVSVMAQVPLIRKN